MNPGTPASAILPRRLRLLQGLDRRVGPWLMRLAPRRVQEPAGAGAALAADSVERILVIRPGGLGDAALSWPLVHQLLDHFRNASLDLLAETRNAAVYELGEPDPRLRVLRYDQDSGRVWRELRRRNYELIIDTEQYHHFSSLLANQLAPRWLAGFSSLRRARLQTHPVAHREDEYEAASFLNLGRCVTGRDASALPPFIPLAEKWRRRAKELLAGTPAPFVSLMTGAGSPYRLWPADRFAAVARWLRERELGVVLIGGADGAAAATEIAASAGVQATNLAGRTSLAETAGILSHATLSVSADTGILHLACGLGTPTVGLFGPGLHQKWAPPQPPHQVVRLDLPCSPCMDHGRLPPCPYQVACMRDLPVDSVTAAIARCRSAIGEPQSVGL